MGCGLPHAPIRVVLWEHGSLLGEGWEQGEGLGA